MDRTKIFGRNIYKANQIGFANLKMAIGSIDATSSKLSASLILAPSDALELEILVELEGSMMPISNEGAPGRLSELAAHQPSYAYQVTKKSVVMMQILTACQWISFLD